MRNATYRANLGDLVAKVLVVRDGGGLWSSLSVVVSAARSNKDATHELAGLRETRTEETGDLLDEGLRREEGVVLLGELSVRAEMR